MANDTFNPNSYGDTQIANALKYALEDHAAIPEMQSDIAAHTSSISALRTANARLLDLLNQIIYRGSDNVLQLVDATVTTTEGITATLTNGILHIVQDAVSDDQTVTLSGIDIPAGTWYFGLTSGAIPLPLGIITAWLKDNLGNEIASTVEGASDPFTVDAAITGGSLEIETSSLLVTGGRDIILYLADKQLSTVMPYFPSLIEVSENA